MSRSAFRIVKYDMKRMSSIVDIVETNVEKIVEMSSMTLRKAKPATEVQKVRFLVDVGWILGPFLESFR